MKKCIKFCFPFFFVFCSCNSYPQIFVWIATIVWPLYRLAKIEILQLNGIRNTKIISYILWTKKKTVSIDENAPNSKSFFLFHSAKLRPQKTSYGRTHMVLYVTPSDVPTDVLRTPHADVMRTFPYALIFNSKGRFPPTYWGRSWQTSWGRPKNVFIWFYK